jgi:two-component system sensor histidine kinase RegB
MLLDLGNLTALLYFTGGMTNPFSLFYFVNLGLAGILLPSPWPWLLNALAVACVSVLFFRYHPVPALQSLDHGTLPSAEGMLTFSQAGLLAAFAACSSVIVYFTTRLTGELRARERELRAAETRRARGEKLEALGTLAAGAAHELATPLSTIAVVVREIERELDTREAGALLQDDMRVLRQELERCRTILNRMSLDSGQAIGEPFTTVTAGQVIAAALSELPEAGSVTTESDDRADRGRLRVPLQGLAQAVRGIVQNAVDASPSGQSVCVLLRGNGTHVRLSICDQGPGMSPEVLQRVGEPFFTTKPPGSGMGLGVFLARSVVERLGGRLEIRSQLGAGTQVEIKLPAEQPAGGGES